MAADFAAGTLGGIAGVVAGYPADTVKVRLQTTLVDPATGRPLYRGTWHCFTSIVRQETVYGLFRGMSSPVAAVGLINSLLFGVYGHFLRLQQTTEEQSRRPTVKQVFLAGVGSGFINSFIACPVELAKIRLQNQATLDASQAAFKGPLQYLKHTLATEGLRGCYRGITPTILRETPSYGVYFASYETLCQWLTPVGQSVDELPWTKLLLAGGLSGIAGWVCIYPIDVIKTKMQGDSRTAYKHTIDCLTQSYRTQGLRVFGSGLIATLLRAFPTNAATLLVYTISMRLFHQQHHSTSYDSDPSRTAASITAALE